MSNKNGHFMSQKPSAVIFDLDGTLVDSARDLIGALNYVLRQCNRDEVPLSLVRELVGDGALAMIKKGFSETGTLPSKAEINVIWQEFLIYYSENITRETIIFPGALKAIQSLFKQNIPIGLCTNKSLELTKKLMSEIGLAEYFSVLVGGDSFEYRKPDPRHILSTIEMMDANPSKAIMVGDSANDIVAAQKAGIPVIGVTFGYSKTPISELNPNIIIDHYDDFLEAVEEISARP